MVEKQVNPKNCGQIELSSTDFNTNKLELSSNNFEVTQIKAPSPKAGFYGNKHDMVSMKMIQIIRGNVQDTILRKT